MEDISNNKKLRILKYIVPQNIATKYIQQKLVVLEM
jgi:hypothetical protein